jgi:biotin synthase
MASLIDELKHKAAGSEQIQPDEALALYRAGAAEPFRLMAAASELRELFKGRLVSLCAIVNAKSGLCPENCRFCAQSAHYDTSAPVYDLLPAAEIVARGRDAYRDGAHMFGIVTSGTQIGDDAEWNEIYQAVQGLNNIGIRPCASLGLLEAGRAEKLKSAGLFRYHHNLETARSFFHNICSTHDYEEDVATVRTAREAGLSVCSGGIIGLGEGIEHRIEMAATLRELGVDSVPINILNPIPGTPLEDAPQLEPMEILLTVSVLRFLLPDKDIKLCGGKEHNLRQLLPLGIVAGANSLMTGNYLTTTGRNTELDLELIRDLRMTAAF